jgi:hypothetical protein
MVNLGGMILQWNNKLQEKKETTKCMVEIIVSLLFKYISWKQFISLMGNI